MIRGGKSHLLRTAKLRRSIRNNIDAIAHMARMWLAKTTDYSREAVLAHIQRRADQISKDCRKLREILKETML